MQTETFGRENVTDTPSGERALLDELKATRAELQTAIEYMQTTDAELESTNEELESSKEELYLFNDEMNAVNSQLELKIGELERAINHLNNLLVGSDTATLFFDTHFRVKWFSPATKEQFDLVSFDISSPIGHFARKFSDEHFLVDAEMVLRKLTTIEANVRAIPVARI